MNKTQLCLLAVTLLFQANTQAAAVVVNGDFEDDKKWEPGVRTELWSVGGIDYAGASDWSLTESFGGGGHVDTGGKIGFPQSGEKYMEVDHSPGGGAEWMLSTTMTGLKAGESYALSFWFSATPPAEVVVGLPFAKELRVVGRPVSESGMDGQWQQYTGYFIAEEADMVLGVRGTDVEVYLDNFTVEPGAAPAGVPEPSSAVFGGLAAIGLLARRRR